MTATKRSRSCFGPSRAHSFMLAGRQDPIKERPMTTATESLSEAARSFVAAGPHRLFIGGDWVEAAGGRTFETLDPSTGEPICEVAFADAEDVDRAAKAARTALEGPWSQLPASQRGRLMYVLADLIEANADELAELESLDNGKPV